MAKIGQDGDAVFVSLKHAQEHGFRCAQGSLEHQFLCFVQPLELVIGQVVGVFEGVVSHGSQPCGGREI